MYSETLSPELSKESLLESKEKELRALKAWMSEGARTPEDVLVMDKLTQEIAELKKQL